MNDIEIFIHIEGEITPRQVKILEGEIAEDILKTIHAERHHEHDLVFGEIVIDPQKHLHEHGIKHGDHLHSRKKHGGHGHHGPELPKIFIDNKEFRAPKNPMTGDELKGLAKIGANYDLWEKVPGKDDIRIENNQSVTLTEGEHFYSAPSTLNPGSH